MSERKPSDDFKEGLGLIFRAARQVVQQVDVSKIDKSLEKAIESTGKVVYAVGQAVSNEVNRVAARPPWERHDRSEEPSSEPVDPPTAVSPKDDTGRSPEDQGPTT